MAVINAVASGNWSNSATWPGGIFPSASDDVHANGFTITVDQDITVLSINTTSGGGGVAGGSFHAVSDETHIINADVNAGSTTCFSFQTTS